MRRRTWLQGTDDGNAADVLVTCGVTQIFTLCIFIDTRSDVNGGDYNSERNFQCLISSKSRIHCSISSPFTANKQIVIASAKKVRLFSLLSIYV